MARSTIWTRTPSPLVSYEFGEVSAPVVEAPAPVVTPEPVVVTIDHPGSSETIYFEFNSRVLSESYYDELLTLAQLLQDHPEATAKVTGFASSTGSSQYNLQLSEDRAISVAQHLMNAGIDAARLTVSGQGEVAADATGEEGCRVEVVVPNFSQYESTQTSDLVEPAVVTDTATAAN